MAEGELLTTEEAAWVFRRAAELDVRSADVPEALLDQRTLEAAGVEAGLSPVSIRAALQELRTGALAVPEPDPDVPPGRRSIVRVRAVPGPPAQVAHALDELARRNVLVVRRRRGASTVWERRNGVIAACQRVKPHPLCGVARLAATLGPVPGAPDLVRVELRAEPVASRRLVPLRTRIRVATGVGVGAGVAAAAVAVSPLVPADVLLAAAGAGGAGWAGASGLRDARAARDALGDALAYALDRLEDRRTPVLVLV